MLTIEKFKVFYKALNTYQASEVFIPQSEKNIAARAALDYFNFLNEPEKYATEANKKYLIAKIWFLYNAKYFDCLLSGLQRSDIEGVVEDIQQGGIVFLDMPVNERGVFLHQERAKEKPSVPTANIQDNPALAVAPDFVFLTHQVQHMVINPTLFEMQQLIRQGEFLKAITLCKKQLQKIEATERKIGKPNIQFALVTTIDFYVGELNNRRPKQYQQIIQYKLESVRLWEEINAKITSGSRDYQILDKKEMFYEYGLLGKLYYEARFDVDGSLEDLDHAIIFLKKEIAYFQENYDVEYMLNYHYEDSDINLFIANLRLLNNLYLHHVQFEKVYMFCKKLDLSVLELEKAFFLLKKVLVKLRDNKIVGQQVVEFAQVKLEELYHSMQHMVSAIRLGQNWEVFAQCVKLTLNVLDLASTIPDGNTVPKFRVNQIDFLCNIDPTICDLMLTKNKYAAQLYDLLASQYTVLLLLDPEGSFSERLGLNQQKLMALKIQLEKEELQANSLFTAASTSEDQLVDNLQQLKLNLDSIKTGKEEIEDDDVEHRNKI